MSMREVAKHLSAMGRHGDTTLVHMSPQEVSALHGIAALHGTHLTHNPHTGLPEAFSIGGFFKSLLPTLAGAAATTLSGGALAPVVAGAVTGAALNSGNPLMGAISGGIGGYGGMDIGKALNSAGGAEAVSTVAPNVSTVMNSGSVIPGGEAFSQVDAAGKLTSFTPETAAAQTAASRAPTTFDQMGQGIANLGTEGGRDAFVKSLGGTGPNADLIAAGKAGMPLVMAGLAGAQPKPPEEDKYDPYARLKIPYDTGLRLYADGGSVFETPDPGSDPNQDAAEANQYGIGGLSGYAKGGYLDGPGDGMSDSIPATIEGKQPARLADGEFVVPADVVSHLGNGSTKAGAQRLYSMMDKVRKARTGTEKQGRQINPNKYMPA